MPAGLKVGALLLFAGAHSAAQNAAGGDFFLLSNGTVHPISGAAIENGSVLIHDGKIIGVGKNLHAPEGAKVIDIHGQHVYPGMIDSAGMPGLEKASNDLAADSKENGLLNPQLRVADAINPASEMIPAARVNGITSVMEMPEGDLLAGQLSLVHMQGSTNNDMSVAPSAAVCLRFPAIVTTRIAPHEVEDDDEEPYTAIDHEPVPYEVAKKDYDEKMQALNSFFEDARRYRQLKTAQSAAFRPNPRFEAMLPVLDGVTPLFVTAVRERAIREAIAFAEKQKVRIILADAYEAYKVLDLIKAHDVAVVLGPPLSLPLDEDTPYDRSYTTANDLYKAGIRFSIATFSYRLSRNLPNQAAAAVAFGLPHDEAYKSISLSAAQIFGLDKRLGSIEEGKVADLIVTDGDPLETMTHVNYVFIDGKPVSLGTRQKQLYEKYLARP